MLVNSQSSSNTVLEKKAPSVIASTTLAASVLTATINDLEGGVNFEYYRGEFDNLPDFATLAPDLVGVTSEISIDDKFEQEVTAGAFSADGNYACRFTGAIQIREAGMVSFTLGSNDGAALYVAGKTVARNDGSHYYRETDGQIKLHSPGMYPITVLYFHKTGKILEGVVSGNGPQLSILYGMVKEGLIFSSTGTKQPIPPTRLFHIPSKSPPNPTTVLQRNGTIAKPQELPTEDIQTALDEERAQSQIVKRTVTSMLNVSASDEEVSDMSIVDMVERLQQDIAKLRRDYFFSIGLAYKLASKKTAHLDLQNAWESLPEKMDHVHFGQFIRSQTESKTALS